MDVSRAEYENLLSQVVQNARAIQRMEAEFRGLERRLGSDRRRHERDPTDAARP
jgi:hypothetical protein